MSKKLTAIEVEGLREFQRAARRSTDTELPNRLGRANKSIGELVISKLDPKPDPRAIGEGRGSAVRASATKRDVILRAGGAHRAAGPNTRMQLWGRLFTGRPGIPRPPRPHIRGTIEEHRDEIEREYLKAISAAMSGAFHKTTP